MRLTICKGEDFKIYVDYTVNNAVLPQTLSKLMKISAFAEFAEVSVTITLHY